MDEIKLRMRPCVIYVRLYTPCFASGKYLYNGNVVKRVSEFQTCRENLIGNIMSSIDEILYRVKRGRIPIISTKNHNKIKDKDTKEEIINYYKCALNTLNLMEDRNGWPLTKLKKGLYNGNYCTKNYCTKFDALNRARSYFIFEMPLVWLRGPQMLSLYLLLIRASAVEGVKGAKTYEDLMVKLRKFAETPKVKLEDSLLKDHFYIRRSIRYWEVLMENVNVLYRGRTIEQTFRRKSNIYKKSHPYCYNMSPPCEGIDVLIQGPTRDLTLLKRFTSLCESRGIKIKPKGEPRRKYSSFSG